MIHHFARALAVREQARAKVCTMPDAQSVAAAGGIVVSAPAVAGRSSVHATPRALRMRRDPSDARRTVITGRFAEVCAALDRMVAELEPA
ncbi:MAG: hypothetical protein EOP38_19475 [Rubrivivax sp.]|nr:MAG: hypothetical protein EOP38_19475 [Rubrivivax sp.]